MSGSSEWCDNADSPADTSPAAECTTQLNTDEKTRSAKDLVQLFCKMVSDLLIVILVVSSVISVVHNTGQPLTRAARKPKPFFKETSLVRDYFRGHVFTAFHDATYYESSFFMFYASWDRESMQAREVMEELAELFVESDIMVAAVNCWYPTSDCAKEFGSKNGANSLPVFIYYPKLLSGIQYRGLVRTDHLAKFIQGARFPLTHIHSQQHLHSLQGEFSSVLVGYIPGTTTYTLDDNHLPILQTSLALMETFSQKAVLVGVVTDTQLAKQLHLHYSQPVKLFTWNSTLSFPNRTVDTARLVSWALKVNKYSTGWVSLPGRKTQQLSKVLATGSGNTLLVFTPRSLLQHDSVYHNIRQISAEYHNCDNLDIVNSLVKKIISHGESAGCSGTSSGSASRVSLCSDPVTKHCHLGSWSEERPEEAPEACSSLLYRCQPNSTVCEEKLKVRRSLTTADSNVNLMLEEVERERENLVMASTRAGHTHSLGEGGRRAGHTPSLGEDSQLDIRGLGCNSNQSLRIFSMDSVQHQSLIFSLGLDSLPLPLPVIINVEEESVVIPPPQLRRGPSFGANLRRLIHLWHQGQLTGRPGYRSSDRKTFIRFDNEEEEGKSHSVVKQVSAASFGSRVLKSPRDVVLLYTSTFCSHCTAASHVFHSVKLFLAQLESVEFLIVDATKNDLNWEFTAFSYPTIIIFPGNRTEMSRVFPAHLELNVTNLLNFVVSNLKPETRLELALQNCDSFCRNKVRLTASALVKRLTTERLRQNNQPRAKRAALNRNLNFAKHVLYVISAMQEVAPNSPKMPGDYHQAIVENFLKL